MCESTFVKFDLNGIWFGLTLNCVLNSVLVILSWDKVNLRSVVNPKLLLSLPLTFVLGALLSYFIDHQWFDYTNLFTIFAAITLPVCGLGILWRIRFSIGPVLRALYENSDCLSAWHILFLLASCASLSSNSFVVEEAHLYAFFMISSLLLYAIQNGFMFSSKRHFLMTMLLLALIRASKVYFRCREEQQGYCEITDFHKSIGETVLKIIHMLYIIDTNCDFRNFGPNCVKKLSTLAILFNNNFSGGSCDTSKSVDEQMW